MSIKSISKRKMKVKEPTDIVKIFRFMAWLFLMILIIDILYLLVTGIGYNSLVILIISSIFSGLSFGASSQIHDNPAGKHITFRSFLISITCVGIFAILVFAVYQW